MINDKYKDIMSFKNNFISDDDLHDAILVIGLDLEAELYIYYNKAKQIAINRIRQQTNRISILNKNEHEFKKDILNLDHSLNVYNFDDIEQILVNELLAGIPKYKSLLTRTVYARTFRSVKLKVLETV